jgi:hypothetical protein
MLELIARLGNVLYWTAASVAALIIVVGIPAGLNEVPSNKRWTLIAVFILMAGAVWLFGRACRYILVGR